ncbi:DUF1822 family protein [Phormidesmis priestleyi]
MSTHTDITGLLDLQTLRESVIPLEPEHFDRALQLSRSAMNEPHQWSTYINGLALCGFVEWLEERATGLAIQENECSLLQPEYASVLDAVCNLVVGGFTLCLVVTESVAKELVTVPRAVVELPEFSAHLYVLLEVQEEQGQIILRGCLRYDQLMQYQQSAHLTTQSDQTYTLPLDWFDPDSSHLLFYLKFLEPSTLVLPAITPPQSLMPLQQTIAQLTSLNQPIINVWNWSQNLLDATAQALSWSMPQTLTPAFAMRRSLEKVEAAFQDLIQRQEVDIPQHARYAYTTLAGTPFQFCAVTWLISTNQPTQEWALLLILVAQPGKVLPVGTKLQVSTTTVLAEVTLETMDLYLYVLVEGNQDEAFTPTILPANAAPIILPAFICHPNSAQ